MALNDTLAKELLGKKSVASISKSTGVQSNQVTQLVTAALPILLSGMCQNAESEEGAQSLATALESHAGENKKDTASMLADADVKDGEKAVQHILGDQTKDITKGLSKQTGISSKQVMTILATLAPVLLSLLGSNSETGKDNQVDSSGLGGVLTSLLFGSNSNTSSTKDAGIDLASIAGALLGGSSSSGKNDTTSVAGALLGGLLGGSDSDGKDDAGELVSAAGSLLGGLLGGSSSSSSSKKDDSLGDALGGLLSGLLK